MSSIECDVTHKESLMANINALFQPPTCENHSKKMMTGLGALRRAKKASENYLTSGDSADTKCGIQLISSSQHQASTNSSRDDPFWKKPRNNCHDFCDSCGCIEGERLVCDKCPASFHLECLDPPMDPEDAATGVWYCHRCTMLLRDEEDKTSTSSSQHSVGGTSTTTAATEISSIKSAPRSGAPRGRPKKYSVPNAPSSRYPKEGITSSSSGGHLLMLPQLGTPARSSRSGLWGDSMFVADIDASELNALWRVIAYARYQNPKEFDLPKDLMPGMKIPGGYKSPLERKGKGIIDLDNGTIPLPVRRCFACSKTCLQAPLLPCDYCQACFHLECLDPPLSSFPPRSERWMCPLHAEQTIDECLVRSIRLTERMHLWDTLAEAKYDALTTRTGSAAELAAYQGIVFRRSTRSKIEPATYTEYSTAPGVSLAPLSCPIVDQTSACLDPEATTDSGTDSNAQTDSLVADSSGDEVGDEPGELRCSDEEERERGTVNRDVRVEDTEEEDEQSRNAGHEIEEEENVGAPFINSADEQISDSEDNLLVGVTKPRSVYSPPVQLYQRSSSAMSRARAPTSCAVRNGSGTLNCDSKDRGSATIVEMSSTNLPTGASHDVLYGPDEEAVILADLMHQARRANAVSTALLGLAAIDGRSGHRTIPCSAETAPATSIVRPRPGQDSRGSSHAGYLEASPCVETPRGLWRFHSSTLSAEAGPTLPGAIGLHQEGLQWLTSEQQFIASRVNSSSLRIVVPAAVKQLYANPPHRLPRPSEFIPHDKPAKDSLDSSANDEETFLRALLEFHVRRQTPPNQPTALNNSQVTTVLSSNEVTNEKTSPAGFLVEASSAAKAVDTLEKFLSEAFEQVRKKFHGSADFEANSYHGMSADILTTMLSQDTNLLRLLTHRWVTQLLSSHEYAVTPNPTLTRLDCEYRVGLSESECRLAARAVLIPVEDTLGPTIRMSYRQLNVGTDPDSHLRLSQYQLKSSLSPTAAMTTRHCRFVSPTHAVVFYDEWTRHYELLNYSEHGTLVDSVLYSNDISEKPICQLKPSELVRRARNLIRREGLGKRSAPFDSPGGMLGSEEISGLHATPPKRLSMASRRQEDLVHLSSTCSCTCLNTRSAPFVDSVLPQKSAVSACNDASMQSDVGWEGSAILRHGSLLQFGCYRFLFSLVDRAPVQLPNQSTWNKITSPVSDRSAPPHVPSTTLQSPLVSVNSSTISFASAASGNMDSVLIIGTPETSLSLASSMPGTSVENTASTALSSSNRTSQNAPSSSIMDIDESA